MKMCLECKKSDISDIRKVSFISLCSSTMGQGLGYFLLNSNPFPLVLNTLYD